MTYSTATCDKCGEYWMGCAVERWKPEMCECGGNMLLDHRQPLHTGWPEFGITMEHVGPNPVHFKTRREAQEFATKNNMELGCL